MNKKFETKQAKEFFSFLENIQLSIISRDDWSEIKEKLNQELRKVFDALDERDEMRYNDDYVMVNDYPIYLFLPYVKRLIKNFKKEVEKNLNKRKSVFKDEMLYYLADIIHNVDEILHKFYMQPGVWTDADLDVIFYKSVRAPEELFLEGRDDSLKGKYMISLAAVFAELKEEISILSRWLEHQENKIKLLSQERFNVPSITVLAHYYYYMIDAGYIKNFKKVADDKKITIEEAMQQQLEKDGFLDHTGKSLRNAYKKVKTYAPDNLRISTIQKTLPLLEKYEAAKKRAENDIEELKKNEEEKEKEKQMKKK